MSSIKIGIIADIHAELPALERALAILDGLGIDQIVCAGDLIGKGSKGDAVVRRVMERGIACITGNHDMSAREEQRWLLENTNLEHPNYPRLLQLCLSDEALDYLETLPSTRRYVWADQRVLMAHGTPEEIDEYLYFYSPDRRYKEIARETQADVIILGHTHEPMIVQVRPRVWIVNPGSVCFQQSFGSGTCAVLSLPEFNFNVFDLRTGSKLTAQYRQI